MAKDQDMMTRRGLPMKNVIVNVHLITTAALAATSKVKVQKEKEGVIGIKKKPMSMSRV